QDLNFFSNANASINAGSFDPDGEGVTVTQSPAGPYSLGSTNVNLTVVDNNVDHAPAVCSSTITVKDMQKPNIAFPAPTWIGCTSLPGASATIARAVSDNWP